MVNIGDGHRRSAEIYRHAGQTHDRTAALHEDSADLHEGHARQVAHSPERAERAHRVADTACEAAARARTSTDRERAWVVTAANDAERAAAVAGS